MKAIEKLTNEYGDVYQDGNRYALIQQVYTDNGPEDFPHYEALAIRYGDQPDANGYVDTYRVVWEIINDTDDGCDACDWDNPYDITKQPSGYNIETGRIC